ncbi:YggS family pyridoxal phosphate-dependent enzyme [Comamonas flocculans]|uniref:Pyridoxal phosphate homeostasis protein n=1 Tax=Comamonas flocculans TaxID=2597701 RepID=A0A5B8RSM3_9BURK|nr:YggS family pyridoxal phosphate-dependent enzyme [Comamonas flocculans]QEA12659.1 YggS family pyridoxal phosphate-dependent enzyme [Comamonas flocculans]
MTMISDNLQAIRGRIARACAACARDPAGVRLLAVSKTFGPDALAQAVQAGQHAFGENYIQEALDKMGELARRPLPALQWHCIGPIQSNKSALVARHFDWAQTLDRPRIAQRLSEQRPAELPPLCVCVQVNVDGGATKSGVAADEAVEFALAVARLPRLQLRGVMSIPDALPDFDAQRQVHERARAVFDAIAARLPAGHTGFDTLSLGMTADLEAAIAAGSTLVRVGSGIFGARHYPAGQASAQTEPAHADAPG